MQQVTGKNRMRSKTVKRFRNLSVALIGFTVGVTATVVVFLKAKFAIEMGIIVGLALGVALVTFFVVLKNILSVVGSSAEARSTQNEGVELKLALAKLLKLNEHSDELVAFSNTLSALLRNGFAAWSATISLGLGVAAIGTAVAFVTALASIQQVERIDLQNALIEEQLLEAKSARVSSLFSAQLPSFLQQVYQEKGSEASWKPSGSLISRIQFISNLVEPYKTDPQIESMLLEGRSYLARQFELGEIDTEMLGRFRKNLNSRKFSPERGQLLQILLSAGMDFEGQSLSFEAADLSRAELRTGNFGSIDLSHSNLYSTTVRGNFSNVILRGAILPFANELFHTYANTDDPASFNDFELALDGAILPSRDPSFQEAYENGAGEYQYYLMGQDLSHVQNSLFAFCEYLNRVPLQGDLVFYMMLNNFHYCS